MALEPWNVNPSCCSVSAPAYLCPRCKAMLRQGFEAALNADYSEFESDGTPIPNESLELPTMNWGELSANAAGGFGKKTDDEEFDDQDYDDDEISAIERENRKRIYKTLNAYGDVLPDSGGFASVAAERARAQRREVRNRRKKEACGCSQQTPTRNVVDDSDVLPVATIDYKALSAERKQK